MSLGHIYWAVVDSVWQSAAIALVLALALRTVRGSTAAQRHALWLGVLVATAVLPFANLAMPMHAIAIPVRIAAPAPEPVRAEPMKPVVYRVTRAGYQVDAPVLVQTPKIALPPIPVLLWSVIAFSLLLRLGAGYVRLRFAKGSLSPDDSLSARAMSLASGSHRNMQVGTTRVLSEPCVIGFVRPAIALPASLARSLSDEDVTRVLRHECAHISRYDDYANLIQQIIRAVFFFNPVAHIASRAMAIECEVACDDAAACVETDRVAFAKCLYEIAKSRRNGRGYVPAAGFIGSRKQIVLRVGRLLERNHNASTRLGLAMKALASAIAMAGVALGGIHLTAVAQPAAPAVVARVVKPPLKKVARVSRPIAKRIFTVKSVAIATPVKPVARPIVRAPQVVRVYSIRARAPRGVRTRQFAHQHTHLRMRAAPQIAYDPQHETDTGGRSDGDLIDSLSNAGYKGLSPDDLIDLSNHGVTGDFINKLRSYGFGPLPVRTLIALVDHGVTPDYLATLRQAGYSAQDPQEIIRLVDHGVTAEFVRSMNSALNRTTPVDDLVRMVDAGVTSDFTTQLVNLGYRDVSPRDLVRMANAGITADFVQRIIRSGITGSRRPDVEELIKLRNAGV